MAISLIFFLLLSSQIVQSYHRPIGHILDAVNLAMSSGNFDGYRQSDTKKGAYEIAAASEIKMPCIILVNPFLDQNVGSCSRAMVSLRSIRSPPRWLVSLSCIFPISFTLSAQLWSNGVKGG
jgi:hypothetical protein